MRKKGESKMNCFESAPSRQKKFTLAAVYFLVLGSVLISSTDTVILPIIAQELNGMDYFALTKAFSSVTAAVTMPLFAYLMSKDPSRKHKLFIFGAVCGALNIFSRTIAVHMFVVVGGGVLNGIFSTAVYVVGYTMVRDIYDAKNAAKYLGYVGTINSLGVLAGPIISGVLIDNMGWRFVSHIVWITIIVSAVLMFNGVKVTREEAKPLAIETGAAFDFSGAVFQTLFLGALTLFLALGSSLAPFGGRTSNIFLVLTIVGLIGLIAVIRKKGDGCIIPAGVLKDRNALILTIDSFLMNFALMSVYFFVPSFILYVLEGTATQSSLATTLISVAGLFMAPVFANMIGKDGSAKRTLTIGMIIRIAVLVAFIVVLGPDTKLVVIYVLMFLAGFYQSQHTVTMSVAPQIQLTSDKRMQGNAMIQVTMAIGSSIGAAVYSMIIASQGVATGLRTSFIIAAAAALIVLIISQFLTKVQDENAA